MTEISQIYTLHDITEGNPSFIGNVHIESEEKKPFSIAYPTQKELDDGTISFTEVKNGYYLVPIRTPGTGFIALKSEKPQKVRIWTDAISTNNSSPSPPSPLQEDKNISMYIWIAVIVGLLFILIKKSSKT